MAQESFSYVFRKKVKTQAPNASEGEVFLYEIKGRVMGSRKETGNRY